MEYMKSKGIKHIPKYLLNPQNPARSPPAANAAELSVFIPFIQKYDDHTHKQTIKTSHMTVVDDSIKTGKKMQIKAAQKGLEQKKPAR